MASHATRAAPTSIVAGGTVRWGPSRSRARGMRTACAGLDGQASPRAAPRPGRGPGRRGPWRRASGAFPPGSGRIWASGDSRLTPTTRPSPTPSSTATGPTAAGADQSTSTVIRTGGPPAGGGVGAWGTGIGRGSPGAAGARGAVPTRTTAQANQTPRHPLRMPVTAACRAPIPARLPAGPGRRPRPTARSGASDATSYPILLIDDLRRVPRRFAGKSLKIGRAWSSCPAGLGRSRRTRPPCGFAGNLQEQ